MGLKKKQKEKLLNSKKRLLKDKEDAANMAKQPETSAFASENPLNEAEDDYPILGAARSRLDNSTNKVSRPKLKSQRVLLRPAKQKDAEAILRWMSNNPAINRIGLSLPVVREELVQWIHKIYRTNSEKEPLYIIEQEDNIAIGMCGFFNLDQSARRAEFGIIVGDKSYLGNNYGHEAIVLMMELAFFHLNINRVETFVLNDDDRSLNSFQKVGFNKEGELYEYTYVQGEYKNAFILSMLKNEYIEQTDKQIEQADKQIEQQNETQRDVDNY